MIGETEMVDKLADVDNELSCVLFFFLRALSVAVAVIIGGGWIVVEIRAYNICNKLSVTTESLR